ncbi:unnamed protein product [Rotaria sp. Silwood2]|nr:unnamed protein product [Rotaria sp. Silwood2]
MQSRNDTKLNYNGNIKIESNRSILEHLANEMIYEIFEYLDYYDVYNGFCYLNKRFQYLVLYSIIPNKHRINVLSLSNPFAVDIVLSPPPIISDFVRLETLIPMSQKPDHY